MTAVAPNLFRPVRRARTAQVIVDQIRGLLAHGHMKAGDRLPAERKLADVLGVGRTTIREALRVMETMGLVVVRPGDGTYLVDPAAPPATGFSIPGPLAAWRSRLDLFELRMVLEPGLAALAARRAAPEAIVKMQAVLATQRASVERGETGMEEDEAFHRLVAESTENGPLMEIVRGLTDCLQETRDPSLATDGRPLRSLRQNQAVLAAIEGRNPGLAMRRMLAHIRSIERALFAASAGHSGSGSASPPTGTDPRRGRA